jgi:hypothetical protein
MLYRPGQQNVSGAPSSDHRDQVISNGVALPYPLEGRLDSTGETITLLSVCNWQGHSPADIAIDSRGKQLLATFDEVTIIDGRALPPNPTADAIRKGTPESVLR